MYVRRSRQWFGEQILVWRVAFRRRAFALRLDGLDAAHDRSHDFLAETEVAYNFPADTLHVQRVHCPHHCALKTRERCRGDTCLPWSLWTTDSSCSRASFWFREMLQMQLAVYRNRGHDFRKASCTREHASTVFRERKLRLHLAMTPTDDQIRSPSRVSGSQRFSAVPTVPIDLLRVYAWPVSNK